MIKTCRCGKEYETGEVFPLPVCPKCADQWDAEIEAQYTEKNEAGESEADRLDALGIRPRHYPCTFDNFDLVNDGAKKALEVCRRMAETRRGIIALIGNNGTGKTHLACATVRHIGAGRIYKMVEVGMFIRKAFDKESRLDEQGQLDKLVELPFLAIDEIEKSKRTENEINWLSYLIDERNERYRPTMLIGNCHPLSSCSNGGCDKCFESIMTPDVLDRISQVGVIRYLDGESYRKNLRGRE
jgi:DNA replication protein DnaC